MKKRASQSIPARYDLEDDLSWVPFEDLDEGSSRTAQDYVQAYLADPGQWWWSTYAIDYPREKLLPRCLAILARARLPEHREAIGAIGVGPFEDMLGDWMLDRLQAYLPFEGPLRDALALMRVTSEPPAVQKRLRAMMAVSVEA